MLNLKIELKKIKLFTMILHAKYVEEIFRYPEDIFPKVVLGKMMAAKCG